MIEALVTFAIAVLLVWGAFTFIGNILHAAIFILCIVVVYVIIRPIIARNSNR